MPAAQLLRQPEVRLRELQRRGSVALELESQNEALDLASVETTVKYAGYLKQELTRVERLKRAERRRIPPDFPFARVPGLSKEAVQRLSQVRPETLGQAARVAGMTPAGLAVLGTYLDRLGPAAANQ